MVWRFLYMEGAVAVEPKRSAHDSHGIFQAASDARQQQTGKLRNWVFGPDPNLSDLIFQQSLP
jgi:hypothetical protein